MVSTREDILDYLYQNPSSAVEDISRYLELTPANIRYHLNLLEKSGQVQQAGQRQVGGAGRPINLYNLTPQNLGDSLQELLEVILETIFGEYDTEEIIPIAANKLVSKWTLTEDNLIHRYNQAIDLLNQLKYHASWQAYPEGPGVDLKHCPYRELPLSHPRICEFDQKLISTLFQTDLILTRRRSFTDNPFSPCQFRVAAPGE